MSQKNNNALILVTILVFSILVSVSFINPEPKTLFSTSGNVESDHVGVIDQFCEKGNVKFTFVSELEIDAIIMNEEQYSSFNSTVFSNSLTSIYDVKSGTLSYTITEAQMLYFVIDNHSDFQTSITVFEVNHIGDTLSILQYLRGN